MPFRLFTKAPNYTRYVFDRFLRASKEHAKKLVVYHHLCKNSKLIAPCKIETRFVKPESQPTRFPECFKSLRILSYAIVGTTVLVVGLNIEKLDLTANMFVQSVQAITPNLSRFNFIADVVSKTEPAVVFLEMKGQHPESGKRITESTGSGFLVRPNGLILTTAHVVPRRSTVVVKLHNGDVYEGKVTAVDPVHDLATVKIEPKGRLPFIPLEKSSNIRPGEFVIAMGSPLSLSNTATFGIVSSSKLRGSKELGLENKDMQYIQTDAVISFGNSGGPLVNLDEKAIGINNLKITSGISFAIPADYAFEFLEKAENALKKSSTKGRESPSSKRRFVGITMLPLTPLIINNLKDKLPDFPPLENGVYVLKVNVGSPAYDGGLHAGDILVSVNGVPIQSTQDVYRCVEENRHLKVGIVRGGSTQEIEIVTEEIFR